MNFLEQIIESRDKSQIAFLLFLENYPKNNKSVHAFFEGYADSSFYGGFIRSTIDSKDKYSVLETYVCGNKVQVYNTYKKISRKGKINRCLFFVDKDFSDILSEENIEAPEIYVTEYYSIENYIVSNQAFKLYWDDFIHINGAIYNFENFQRKFNTELNRFYSMVTDIIVWIIYLKRNSFKPNINNINLKKFYILDDSVSIKHKNLEFLYELEAQCGVSTPTNFEQEKQHIYRELNSYKPKQYIRGKFEVWFFVCFIQKMIEKVRCELGNQGESISVSTLINTNNAIQLLGPRISIPKTLADFMLRNL